MKANSLGWWERLALWLESWMSDPKLDAASSSLEAPPSAALEFSAEAKAVLAELEDIE